MASIVEMMIVNMNAKRYSEKPTRMPTKNVIIPPTKVVIPDTLWILNLEIYANESPTRAHKKPIDNEKSGSKNSPKNTDKYPKRQMNMDVLMPIIYFLCSVCFPNSLSMPTIPPKDIDIIMPRTFESISINLLCLLNLKQL